MSVQYGQAVLDQIDTIISTYPRLASIDSVTDLQHRIEKFHIVDTTWVLLHAMGEFDYGPYDWGWLEDENQDTVWKLSATYAIHAGGEGKNLQNFRILPLLPGAYSLHYQTDDNHAFGTWTLGTMPEKSFLWGIRVIILPKSETEELIAAFGEAKARAALEEAFILSMNTDQNGDIWLWSPSNLSMISSTPGNEDHVAFVHVFNHIPLPDLYPLLHEDADGWWFVKQPERTSKKSFIKMDLSTSQIVKSIPILGVSNRIPHYQTILLDGLLKPHGKTWLIAFIRPGMELYNVSHQNDTLFAHLLPLKIKGQELNSFIWSAHSDKEDHLWLGTSSGGLFKITHKTNPIHFVSLPEQEINDNFFHKLCLKTGITGFGWSPIREYGRQTGIQRG